MIPNLLLKKSQLHLDLIIDNDDDETQPNPKIFVMTIATTIYPKNSMLTETMENESKPEFY